ncbi:MAG TPA: hypothetical protein VM821_07015 [Abditibacteriaceae bacterium]|nr:hypothetical protein [Abditibacteriaceae bacterium]
MNKPISRPLHGTLDYVYAVTAWSLPSLLGFENNKAARLVCNVAGGIALLSALTTKHEGGLLKIVPFNTHLKGDAAGSLATVAAPWLFGFADDARARNAVVGLALLQAIVFALTRPDNEYGA